MRHHKKRGEEFVTNSVTTRQRGAMVIDLLFYSSFVIWKFNGNNAMSY